MDRKRLFFALWPDEATRERIRAATAGAVSASRGRVVPLQNVHITLAFLHYVEVRLIGDIVAAAAAIDADAFAMELSRIGYWYRSRILWLGPGENSGQAGGLAAAIWGALQPLGFEPERRPFRPHVTLARKASEPRVGGDIEAVHWRARDFVLVESLTGRRPAGYRVLETFRLARTLPDPH